MPEVIKAAMRWRVGDVDDVVSTFHVLADVSHGPVDAFDLVAVAGAARDWWVAGGSMGRPLAELYSTGDDIELLDVTTYRVAPTVGDPYTLAVGEPGQQFDSPLLPPQVAMLVQLRTTLDTRSGRGRMYLPASYGSTTTAAIASGIVEDDRRDELGACAADLAELIRETHSPDPLLFLAVWSPTTGDARAVVNFRVPSRYATQRRRAKRPALYREYGLDGTFAGGS